jgi:hypothetical protein
VIGPANRVAGTHSTRIETALAFAAWPGDVGRPDHSKKSDDCAYFAKIIGRGKGVGRCREYSAQRKVCMGRRLIDDSRRAARSSSRKRWRRDE